MNRPLFFLPILADAAKQSDLRRGFKDAFATILRTAHADGNRRGLAQFRWLVEEAVSSSGAIGRPTSDEPWAADELAGQVPDDNSLTIRLLTGPDRVGLGDITVHRDRPIAHVAGLTPGRYALALESGRLLWQQTLEPAHLLWADAHPDQPLEMAAASEVLPANVTLTDVLAGGELILRISPGLESGRLTVEWIIPGAPPYDG
jgi:hypothetical protein